MEWRWKFEPGPFFAFFVRSYNSEEMNLRQTLIVFLLSAAGACESAAQPPSEVNSKKPELFERLVDGVRIGQFDLRGIKTWGEFLDRYPQTDVTLEAVTWYEFGGEWDVDAVVRDRKTHEALFLLDCGCSKPEGSKGKTVYFNGKDKRGGRIEVPTFREAEFNKNWAATTNPRYRTIDGVTVGDTLGKLFRASGKIWVMFDLDLVSPFGRRAEYVRTAPTRYEVACMPDISLRAYIGNAELSFVLAPPDGALIAGLYGKDLLPGEHRRTRFITDKYRNDATIKMITTINRCREMLHHERGL